jgi:hypothetical protein
MRSHEAYFFACLKGHLSLGSAELKEMLYSLKLDLPTTDKLY